MLLQNLWVKGKNAFLSLNHVKDKSTLLYLVLLFLLPTQFGKHFWPEYTSLLGFRVDYLSPTLYVTDLLLFFLLLLWAKEHGRRWRFAIKQALPVMLLLVFLLLTILRAQSFPAGLYSLMKVVEMICFGYYTKTHLFHPFVRYKAPLILAVSVSLQSLLVLGQVIMKGAVGGIWYFFGERWISSLTPGSATVVLNGEVFLRPYGTFSHPNVLAGFLLLITVYLTYRWQVSSWRHGMVIKGGVLSLGTLGLLLTLSRIPIALWSLFLLGYGIHSLFRVRLRSVPIVPILGVSGLVLGVCLTLLPLFRSVATRFAQSTLTENSVLVRADLSKTAITLISSSPFLGVGLGNYLLEAMQYRNAMQPLFFAIQPVHNIFLLIGAEVGLLGLFLFLWFLFLTFRQATFSGRVLLLFSLVLGSFDHYLLTLQQGQLLFSFILGYCWAESPARRKK